MMEQRRTKVFHIKSSEVDPPPFCGTAAPDAASQRDGSTAGIDHPAAAPGAGQNMS